MKPIAFPEMTTTWAEHQPPYLPLPVYRGDAAPYEVISCWEMTWRERLTVLWRGRVWLRVLTFGQRLQPQAVEASSPFEPGER